jgi:hypothetical protein
MQWVTPAEFWGLHPTEFWWLVESKKPVKMYGKKSESEVAEIYEKTYGKKE